MLSKQDELKDLPSSIIPQIINMMAQSTFLLKFHIFFYRGEWLSKTPMQFLSQIVHFEKLYTIQFLEMHTLSLNYCDSIHLENDLSL